MTIKDALRHAIKQLRKANIGSAIIDAEILLSFILKKSREFIFSHPGKNLKTYELKNLKTLIKRRAQGEPIAYIIGEKEFYNLKFKVNRGVLIPRPETELIVDLVLKKLTTTNQQLTTILIDVGTGSGCIPISIAKNPPCPAEGGAQSPFLKGGSKGDLKIFATDISKNALKTARQNAKLNGVSKKITFLQGDLLKPLLFGSFVRLRKPSAAYEAEQKQIFSKKIIITANLPYIPTSDWKKLPPNIKNYEPRLALDGGVDGLKYYRQLFEQLRNVIPTRRFGGEESRGRSPASGGINSTTTRATRGSLMLPRDSSSLLAPQNDAASITLFLEHDPRQKSKFQKLISKYFPPPPLPSPSARGRDVVGVKFHKDLAGKWRVAEIQI